MMFTSTYTNKSMNACSASADRAEAAFACAETRSTSAQSANTIALALDTVVVSIFVAVIAIAIKRRCNAVLALLRKRGGNILRTFSNAEGKKTRCLLCGDIAGIAPINRNRVRRASRPVSVSAGNDLYLHVMLLSCVAISRQHSPRRCTGSSCEERPADGRPDAACGDPCPGRWRTSGHGYWRGK